MDFPWICPARWLSDQNFGMCMPPHDFLCPYLSNTHSNYFRPLKWHNQSISKEFGSTVENEKGNYKISLDVQHFRPNDISVKVSDKEIIVEGKHEERQDTHGFISRQFKRRYALPSHCPAENVTSTMSADGILTIIAEKRSSNELEKIVPIKLCGAQSRKAHIENKMTTEIVQKSIKETMKDAEATSDNHNKTQKILKEEHSRLLKPEVLKETISESNGEKSSTSQVSDIMGLSEKKGAMNISGISSKIEESFAKSSLGLPEQLGQKSDISTKIEESLAKSSLGLSGSGQKSVVSASEICAMKGMTSNLSKTLIEESSSSYKSSSMSSTTKTSGKIGKCTSDIITAELKEAAENV